GQDLFRLEGHDELAVAGQVLEVIAAEAQGGENELPHEEAGRSQSANNYGAEQKRLFHEGLSRRLRTGAVPRREPQFYGGAVPHTRRLSPHEAEFRARHSSPLPCIPASRARHGGSPCRPHTPSDRRPRRTPARPGGCPAS